MYDKLISNGGYKSSSSTFGMIIVPTSYIEEFESSGYTDYFTFFNDVKGKSKDQISTEFSIRQIVNTNDGNYQINGALVNMKYANYTRDFGSVAYYTTDGTSYFYQAYNAKKSIQGISIQAIELDQKTPTLTDKELDILYTYTDGNIPRVIYDASKDSHMSKLVNLPISADGTTEWQVTRQIETINGKDYFKIGADELGNSNAIAFSYILEDGIDLSKYDFVAFDLIYNRSGVTIGLGDPNDIDDSAGGWDVTVENEPYTVTISTSFFLGMAFGNNSSWSLMAKNLQAGDTVYISDFVAYNTKSIEKILDTVPTDGFLTKESKDDVDTLSKVISALDGNASSTLKDYPSKISNYSRLAAAQNLPMVAFDANDGDDLLRFEPIAIPNEEASWEGEISQVTYGGYRFFKFTVTKKGSRDCIVYSFTTDGMPLDDYDYMSYIFMTDGENVKFGLGTPEQLEGKLSYLPPLTVQQIPATVDEIVESSKNYCFVAKGLEVGESIYFGDYVSFNTDNIKYMVDNIPDADNITKYDRAAVENAILLYDSLTDEEKLYVDPNGKLDACADKLKDMPYPLIQADKDLSESMFTPVESALDMTLDKFEVTKEALYGDYWFKFTTTETNDSLPTRVYLAGLESIGLNKNIFDYDLLAFDIRLEKGSSFFDGEKEGETDGSVIEIVVAAAKYNNDGTIEDVGDNYLTIVPTGDNTARAYLNLQNYAIYDDKTGELIGYDAECNLVLGVLGARLGESVWIGDITAVSGDMLKTMIDNLPEADRITSADRPAFDEMYYYYELVYDYLKDIEGAWDQACEIIDPEGKVPACMEALSKQALKFYSTDDKYAYSTFKQEQFTVDDGDGYELECTVTDDGRYAFKVLKIGSTNTIGLSYSVEGLDFTGYDFVTFAVETTGTGINDETVKCNVITYAAAEVEGWEEYLTPGEAMQIYISAKDFVTSCGSVLFGVSNLKVGDIIYLTPFSAYNPSAVKNELVSEIDKLPQYEGRGGAEDYQELITLLEILEDYADNGEDDVRFNDDDLLAAWKLLKFIFVLPEYALNAATDIDCVEQVDEALNIPAGDFSISSVYDDGRSWLKITAGAGTTEENAAFLKFNVDKQPETKEGDIIVFLLKSDGEMKNEGKYNGTMALIDPVLENIKYVKYTAGSDSVLVWMKPSVFADATPNNIIAITGLNAGESMYISSFLVINQNNFKNMSEVLPVSFRANDEERATAELAIKIAELGYFDPLTQEQIIRINGTLVLPDIAIDACDKNNMDKISLVTGTLTTADATITQTIDLENTLNGYYKITAGDNVSDANPVMIRFQVERGSIGDANGENIKVAFKLKSDAVTKYNDKNEPYSAIIELISNDAESLGDKFNINYIPINEDEMLCVFKIGTFYDLSLGCTAVFEGLEAGNSVYISDFVTVSEQDVVNMVSFLESLKITRDDGTEDYSDVLKYCEEWIKNLQVYSFILEDDKYAETKDKIKIYNDLLTNSTVSNE